MQDAGLRAYLWQDNSLANWNMWKTRNELKLLITSLPHRLCQSWSQITLSPFLLGSAALPSVLHYRTVLVHHTLCLHQVRVQKPQPRGSCEAQILTNFPALIQLWQWGMCCILHLGGSHGNLPKRRECLFPYLGVALPLPWWWKIG